MTRKRFRTIDRASGDFHTPMQLGPTRHLTREGFLLCENVPIGRTGELLYGPGEVPVDPGPQGYITITRDAAALFDNDTVASFNGKPVTDDHPPGMEVTPENADRYTKGFTINARRGEGEYGDCIVCDLMITHKSLITKILKGKVEVSSGYTADYEDNGGGYGRQIAILGNHVALVDKGRCGPRCAIGDHDLTEGEEDMPQANSTKPASKPQRVKLLADSLRNTLTADEAEELAEQLQGDDAGAPVQGETHLHFHSNGVTSAPSGPDAGSASNTGTPMGDERMDKLEKTVGDMSAAMKTMGDNVGELMKKFGGPQGTGDADDDKKEEKDDKTGDADPDDDAKKTGDSAALANSFKKLTADAEVLVPGFKAPTFDAAAKRTVTVDNMCAVRRSVISHASMMPGGAELFAAVAGADFNASKADCADVAIAFSAAAALKKMSNNSAATGDAAKAPKPLSVGTMGSGAPAQKTPAQINKDAADFWAKQNRMN